MRRVDFTVGSYAEMAKFGSQRNRVFLRSAGAAHLSAPHSMRAIVRGQLQLQRTNRAL